MWYVAAMPFVLLTSFFIYNIVAERKVNLAIEEESVSEKNHGKIKLVEAISKVLDETSQKTSLVSQEVNKLVTVKEPKFFEGGSILLSIKIVKDSEIDVILKDAQM